MIKLTTVKENDETNNNRGRVIKLTRRKEQ